MKTPADPRHQKRVQIIQDLFSWQFHHQTLRDSQTLDITKNLSEIDQIITSVAPEWPLSQINKIDLAILRLAIFELIMKKDTPYKVVIDEAVELAKKFGADSSPSFVNGVLGKVISQLKIGGENKEL